MAHILLQLSMLHFYAGAKKVTLKRFNFGRASKILFFFYLTTRSIIIAEDVTPEAGMASLIGRNFV